MLYQELPPNLFVTNVVFVWVPIIISQSRYHTQSLALLILNISSTEVELHPNEV